MQQMLPLLKNIVKFYSAISSKTVLLTTKYTCIYIILRCILRAMVNILGPHWNHYNKRSVS